MVQVHGIGAKNYGLLHVRLVRGGNVPSASQALRANKAVKLTFGLSLVYGLSYANPTQSTTQMQLTAALCFQWNEF